MISVRIQLSSCPRYGDIFPNGWYDGELSLFKNGNPQTLIPSQIGGISFLKAAFKGPRYKGGRVPPRHLGIRGCCSVQGSTSVTQKPALGLPQHTRETLDQTGQSRVRPMT